MSHNGTVCMNILGLHARKKLLCCQVFRFYPIYILLCTADCSLGKLYQYILSSHLFKHHTMFKLPNFANQVGGISFCIWFQWTFIFSHTLISNLTIISYELYIQVLPIFLWITYLYLLHIISCKSLSVCVYI